MTLRLVFEPTPFNSEEPTAHVKLLDGDKLVREALYRMEDGKPTTLIVQLP